MTSFRPFRALILAGGDGRRWNHAHGVPKHLIEVDGEAILKRTVRLLGMHTADIVVVGADPRYAVWATGLWHPAPVKGLADCKKYLDAEEIWSLDRPTVMFYGDCFYTEEAMEIICNRAQGVLGPGAIFFGREGPSALTGKPYGELFAVALARGAAAHNRFRAEAFRQAEMRSLGRLRRNAGWELYRGLAPGDLRPEGPHGVESETFYEIDDATEDFDFAYDYDRWRKRTGR
jgi:hypothetical protein